MTQLIKGFYSDVLIDPQGQVQWSSSWRSNLIVRNCNLLLAALMKRHQGMQGILCLAIGEGKDDWDSSHPLPLLTDSQLTSELARQALTMDQITYLDNASRPTESPTNHLEITVDLRGEEIVTNGSQSLREFGLFGGNATEEANSGFMINHVIHPRIDLTSGLTLTRKLRLTFTAGTILQEELVGFGADLPVISIDGVGDEYASDFSEQGINTLSDLLEIDPLVPVVDIPQVKLREFRAKARMVTHLYVTLAPFVPLADRSISNILIERPENLAEAIDSANVTTEMATRFQEELAVLQIALDNVQLQRITLGDLINA